MTTETFTVAIIGGGPAGSQCALWLKMMGFSPLIIEPSDHLGGLQALSPYQNQWIAGMLDTSGRELAQRITQHIQKEDIPVMFHADVSSIQQLDNGFLLDVDGKQIEARFIVIASGSIQQKDVVESANLQNQQEHDAAYASLTIDSGWQANLPQAFRNFKNKLLKQDGFIMTDANCETPVSGIFAIGEAANRMPPCVVTAMADGVVAAKAIQNLIG